MNVSVTNNAYTDRKGVVNEILNPDGSIVYPMSLNKKIEEKAKKLFLVILLNARIMMSHYDRVGRE
jgi:hypothetical protein